VLISTSRHVRQMASILRTWRTTPASECCEGFARGGGDPYQLRIYVPDGFGAKRVICPPGSPGYENGRQSVNRRLHGADRQRRNSGSLLLTRIGIDPRNRNEGNDG